MQPHELYRSIRDRLLDLAPSLGPEQQSAFLPATPPWTALDGYRHLAGVCADVLVGNMANAASPEWTAAQLAQRAGRQLAEVCAEWAETGPQLDERIEVAGEAMAFLPYDAWTHEQDIRAATGAGAVRHDELARSLGALAVQTLGPWYARSGAPAAEVVLDGAARGVLGEGATAVTLATTPFELLRMVFGRRSEAQLRAAGWSDAALHFDDVHEAVLAAIHIFACPPADIAD